MVLVLVVEHGSYMLWRIFGACPTKNMVMNDVMYIIHDHLVFDTSGMRKFQQLGKTVYTCGPSSTQSCLLQKNQIYWLLYIMIMHV